MDLPFKTKSNVDSTKQNKKFEILMTPNLNQVISSNTHNMDLNVMNHKQKYQTSIESKQQTSPLNTYAVVTQTPNLFEEPENNKNIKLTESNIQIVQSNLIHDKSETIQEKKTSGDPLLYDPHFIHALKQMKQSITKIKQIGVSELKSKNDTSWIGKEGTEELAAIKAGLGGDVSRVHMISNFSVMSDFDRSGDTLLNLEKYLGGLSAKNGRKKEQIKVTQEELPRLRFYLEKVRTLLGKGRFFG
jgi:hypothetical protein